MKGSRHMRDRFGREITYMRISVTDACNLHCRYCSPLPENEAGALPRKETVPAPAKSIPESAAGQNALLSPGEIREVSAAAVSLGITRFRLTGGEPLLRADLAEIIRGIRGIPGVEAIGVTTNGLLLAGRVRDLADAGMQAVNISLDSLDPDTFHRITGNDGEGLADILAGIRESLAVPGLKVHLNCVPQPGINSRDLVRLAALTLDHSLSVRFIEMMPIGCGRRAAGFDNRELLERLSREYPGITRDMDEQGSGPALYYRIPGAEGTIGLISAMHGKYCSTCNRIRMMADGRLKGCLSYDSELSVQQALQLESTDARRSALTRVLRQAILGKPEGHCFERPDDVTETACMIQIGG